MVTPSPVHTAMGVFRGKHASVHSFYLGPAFEMFVLRVTLLPQSCRSAQLLFLLRCSLLLSVVIRPGFSCGPSLPAPPLSLPSLCPLMWVSDVAQLIVYSCCMHVISS